MRYGNASIMCALSMGAVLAAHAGGCGGGGDGSVFGQSQSGTLTSGSGSSGTLSTGSGSNTGGIITSGSGSGTLAGTGTGSGSGTGGVLDPDAACASQAQDSNAIPSDIFIMMDKSGSMNCPAALDTCENPPMMLMQPTRWKAVSDALNTFVGAPGTAGIGVGIGFFSLAGNNACNVAAYANPTVAIAALPGSGAAITAAIAMNMPGSNTPTVPALTGAINYAKTYTMNTPGRTASVVFVTDGLPNGCNSTIPAAAMVAQAAFMGTPQIKTYVIGLGATANLDQIALAGSGGATHYFPATGDVAGTLVAALKTISGTITCDYVIPKSNVDPRNVNVRVSVGGGAQQTVGKVADATACGALGGWYYDSETAPTKITLCPQSCDPLKATEGSKLQVLLGCPSVPPGVN